jgi:hypothetical protein
MSRPARTLAPPADGQLCTLFAVDIAGFTSPDRDDDIRLYLHEELYEVLEKAFNGSGMPWARCFREDRGDGALVVVPPGIACKGIIDPLPERLRASSDGIIMSPARLPGFSCGRRLIWGR